jgi:hypothetical protein
VTTHAREIRHFSQSVRHFFSFHNSDE